MLDYLRIITKLPIVASRSPCFIKNKLIFFLSFYPRQLMAEVLTSTMGTFWKREVELLKFLPTIFFQEKLLKLKMLVCKWCSLISKESQKFKFVFISFFAVIVAVVLYFFYFSLIIFNSFSYCLEVLLPNCNCWGSKWNKHLSWNDCKSF